MDVIEIGIPAHTEVWIDDDFSGRDLLPASRRATAAVITQPSVEPLAHAFARSLGCRAEVRVVLDRDQAKTLTVAEELFTWLAELGVTRHDSVVGVGGGAVTDLAGFVGSTYLRGIEVVHVPTTLLAAVDAAIGGKTAVNVAGKNLVGTFWHPSRVVIDLSVLRRLPIELLREGSAEAVKCGFIADPALLELYRAGGLGADLAEVVRRAVQVKADVVTEDEREIGRRAHLNYGHTVGHAVEFSSGIPHGHAVAIGMVAAAAASARVTGYDDVDAHRQLLAALGLPIVAPPVALDDVERYMARDKKRDDAGLRMTLLEGPQRPAVLPVDAATVRTALHAIGIR